MGTSVLQERANEVPLNSECVDTRTGLLEREQDRGGLL